MYDDLSCMTICTAWRPVLYDDLSCITTCPAWLHVLHDDMSCMTICPPWRSVMYYDLSCMTICPAWRPVPYDDLSWMTICPAWRYVLHDDHSCTTTCPEWRSVLHDDLPCVTTCPVLLFGSHFCWCFTHRRESRQINFLAAFHNDGKFSPAWRGWGEGCTPSPFTLSTIMSKVVVLQLRGHVIQSSFFSSTLFSSVVLHMLDVPYWYCTYAHILTHYPSTDIGKSEFLAVKLNFNLFDLHYFFQH